MIRFFGKIAVILSAFFIVGSATAQPQVGSVANAASGDSTLAPGSLATIFGDHFALQQPSTVPISVFVNGIDAAVLNVAAQQITVELPVDASVGSAQLRVENELATSAPFQVVLQTVAPGIFETEEGLGSIWHASGIVTLSNGARAGETLSLLCTGLGPTTPTVPTGAGAPSSPRASANARATVSIDGKPVSTQTAYLEPGAVAKFRVFFTVPDTITGGTHSLDLTVGGTVSKSVKLLVTGSGLPTITSVVSSAGFVSPSVIAPGSIVTILGTNFGTVDQASAFPATSVNGTAVTFNGLKAPFFAVLGSQDLLNVYVPAELPEIGNATVLVTTATGSSKSFTVQLAPFAPGVFRIPDPSGKIKNNAAAVLAGTAWIAAPASLAGALHIPKDCSANGTSAASTCAQPVAPGDIIAIFATGLGRATPEGTPGGPVLPTGTVAPALGIPLYRTIEIPKVSVGQIPAEVLFSGLTPGSAGLYQVNVKIPASAAAGDEVQVVITSANGQTDSATIAIR